MKIVKHQKIQLIENTKQRLIIGLFAFMLFIILLLNGCQVANRKDSSSSIRSSFQSTNENGAQVSVFFQLKDPLGPGIVLGIAAVEILSDGIWQTLTAEPIVMDSEEVRGGQKFICRGSVAPGLYQSLRLTIGEAMVRSGKNVKPMELDRNEFDLPFAVDLDLIRGDSKSLFITFDTVASLGNGDNRSLALTADVQLPPLISDLVYVACPDIDTVYIIRSDKNWVYGSIGIKGRPTYLGIDSANQRLYVLAADNAFIHVLELATNQILDNYRVPLVFEPVFMAVNPEGDSAYIVDRQSGNILRLTLPEGRVAAQVRLGERPSYAAYLSEKNLLAVSSSISNSVYLLDSLNLVTTTTIKTGNAPEGMALVEDALYIAERMNNSVSIYDFSTGKISKRIHVGLAPRRLLVDENQIYIANNGAASVGLLRTGQFSVSERIPTGRSPLEMDFSEKRRWIYATSEDPQGLTVIDSTINREVGFIELGTVPLGLAVVQ